MIYEELETIINDMFAARAKSIPGKIVSVWAKEIGSRGFYDQAIITAGKTFMEDDDLPLTLARFLNIAVSLNNKIANAQFKKRECEYCHGLNYVYTNIFFAKNGKYLSQNYAVKCFHNANKDNCAKMAMNEETNNRTEIKGGYMLVFKNTTERDNYLSMVSKNKGYDLWVKDFSSPETEI